MKLTQKDQEILQIILQSRKEWESKLDGKYDDLMKARIEENEDLGKKIALVMIRKEVEI